MKIMKKLVILFVILALVFTPTAIARMGMMVIGGGVSADGESPLCSSCTPGDPSDVFCEDFEGAGYLCTGWSETTVGGTIDKDFTSRFSFTGNGDDALDLDITTAASQLTTEKTWTDGQVIYINFYFILDNHSLADTEYAEILWLADNAPTAAVAGVRIRNDSGTIYFGVDDIISPTWGSTTAISLDTEYEITLTVDTTGVGATDIIKLEVNETVEVNVTDANLGSKNLGRIQLGNYPPLYGGSSDVYNYEINGLRVDNDTPF